MVMSNFLNKYLRKCGIEIKHYPNAELLRRIKLFNHYNIDLVLDVGASVGEYALALRRIGYLKRIVSFEPTKTSFSKLKANSKKDKLWDVFNYALGDVNGSTNINVTENPDSSSLLEISETLISSNAESRFIRSEKIEIKKLDSVFESIFADEKNIFLKLDTQGFEKQILEGAHRLLSESILGLQVELSIVPLYKGSDDYLSIIRYLKEFNFNLYGIEPGFYDKKTGRLLQFDGIFFKE